jgi:cell cycle sensor histidine kinase DivJ
VTNTDDKTRHMGPEAEIEARAARAAANWHGAWFAVLGLAALAWPNADNPPLVSLALAAAAAPGAVGLLLFWRRDWWVKGLVALAWPAGIGAAMAMTGGVVGPLAVLALGPAAAMAAVDGRRLIALGAAMTAAVLAAVVLAANAGEVGPTPAAAAWLALLVMGVTVFGLAAALQMTRARNGEREAVEAGEADRLKRILEAGPRLLLRLDAEGVVRELFCGAPDDSDKALLGKPFVSLAGETDKDAARAAVVLVGRLGEASVGFSPPMAPDRWLVAELRGLPNGEAVALVRDASPERAYEAYLEQARQDAENLAAAKSRFLANMSHELRTPLNAIIGFSDIMRSSLFGPLSARYAEYAGLIHESGGHLLDLINDVLDMSKIEAERFTLTREPFDAREAVSAALRLTRVQADQAKVALRGVLPPQSLEVDADRRALKQIVLNLVSNALKFTPAGGQVNVLARAQGSNLEIIVADTGIGISRTDLERLGRPYEQAGGADQRAMGTGLGLSLVRAFAELHGGAMIIKSRLGEGTAVTVRLPVILDVAPENEPQPAPTASPRVATAARGDNVIAFNPQR